MQDEMIVEALELFESLHMLSEKKFEDGNDFPPAKFIEMRKMMQHVCKCLSAACILITSFEYQDYLSLKKTIKIS